MANPPPLWLRSFNFLFDGVREKKDRQNLIAYDVLLPQVTIFNNNRCFLFEKLTIKVTKLIESGEKKKKKVGNAAVVGRLMKISVGSTRFDFIFAFAFAFAFTEWCWRAGAKPLPGKHVPQQLFWHTETVFLIVLLLLLGVWGTCR